MSDSGGWQRGRGQWRRPQTVAAEQSATGGGKSAYRLGRDFERSVRGLLERRGWLVLRSAMSKGPFDLMAVHAEHRPLLVQCKRRGEIGSEEWNALMEVARPVAAIPVVCYRFQAPAGARQTTKFMRLDDLRVPRAKGRPWTEIDPGTLDAVPLQLVAI